MKNFKTLMRKQKRKPWIDNFFKFNKKSSSLTEVKEKNLDL